MIPGATVACVARLVHRRVWVWTVDDGVPRAFRYRGPKRACTVIERWCESGAWWTGEGEREVFRVLTADGGVYELARDRGTQTWWLERNYD